MFSILFPLWSSYTQLSPRQSLNPSPGNSEDSDVSSNVEHWKPGRHRLPASLMESQTLAPLREAPAKMGGQGFCEYKPKLKGIDRHGENPVNRNESPTNDLPITEGYGSERECVFRAELIKCILMVEEDALFR